MLRISRLILASTVVMMPACDSLNLANKTVPGGATGTQPQLATSNSAVTTSTSANLEQTTQAQQATTAPSTTLTTEPAPVMQTQTETDQTVDNSQFEFVRDWGCVPVVRMLTCKDGSDPSEKIENERCRAKNACSTKDESCIFARMLCKDGSLADGSFATIDMSCQPKGSPDIGGQCKSSARFKRDIHYVTTEERQQLSYAIFNTKLSKYYYKDGVAHDKSRQLGFIIEDQPADSIFVTDDKTHVNLYAFTSGAVAAIQQLKDELAQQQETIKQLKQELERFKEKDK